MGGSIITIIMLFFFIFLLFRVFKNSKSRKVFLVFVVGLVLSLLVYDNFIADYNVKFIQSKVYPNFYIVENEPEDRGVLNDTIKKMIIKKMNNEFIGKENKFKFNENHKDYSKTYCTYSIDYYSYYTGDFFKSGTVWFIENKQDFGGFSTDTFDDYKNYRIASFEVEFCEKDTINFIATIKYYLDGDITKIDTIINSCKKNEK